MTTNRVRLVLVLMLSPFLLPVSLALWIVAASRAAARAWLMAFVSEARETTGFWYREVYRPARYGSVWDDVDEDGRPKAWAAQRDGGAS